MVKSGNIRPGVFVYPERWYRKREFKLRNYCVVATLKAAGFSKEYICWLFGYDVESSVFSNMLWLGRDVSRMRKYEKKAAVKTYRKKNG